MSMLAKLSALFRGTAHEAGQAVVDANALKILDQEIRDADTAQGKARDDLAGLVARRRMAENELKSFGDQIAKYESSVRAAMACSSSAKRFRFFSGSPAGISRITHGDAIECEIEGIGVLHNQVA